MSAPLTDSSHSGVIDLHVLGKAEILLKGSQVGGMSHGSKRLSLFCYLALAEPSAPHDRDWLASVFWPSLEPERARAALRQAIYQLRQALGPDVLEGAGEDIRVVAHALRTDADGFQEALERGALEDALALYGGDLLPGSEDLDAGPAWSEWVHAGRSAFRSAASGAATRLAQEAWRRGEAGRAVQWARRAVEVDPDSEEAAALLAALRDAGRGAARRHAGAVVASALLVLALSVWGIWALWPGVPIDQAATVAASQAVPFVEPQIGGLHDFEIIFDSSRDGNNEIYLIKADGTELFRLTYHPARDVEPAWSPDGRSIVFVSERDGNAEIYRMDPEGKDLTRLTYDPAPDVAPRYSPDGRHIVWASGREGSLDIHMMNADGSNIRRITTHPGDENKPAFAPDGDRIVFQATIDAAGNPRGVDLFVLDLVAGGEPQRLNDFRSFDDEPDWSPDGSRIAFSSARDSIGGREIFVMAAVGTGEGPITSSPGADRHPRWSPDGSMILFRSDRAGAPDLYVMDIDGSNVRRITRRGARRADWRRAPPRPEECLVVNGSFEEVDTEHPPPESDRFYGVPGWHPNEALYVSGGFHNSPDIFVAPESVPRNLFGYQLPAHGRNYAGVAHGWSGVKAEGATEALGGQLREPLRPGGTYEISARFSASETYSDMNVIEIGLFSSRTGAVLTVDTLRVENTRIWHRYTHRIEIAPDDSNAYDEIVFRGANPVASRGYYFLDDVDVCPVG